MIQGLFSSGAMSALERTVQFTSQRHQHLMNNIANLSTPNFQPTDLSVKSFQQSLNAAIRANRSSPGGGFAPLRPRDADGVHFTADGIVAEPAKMHDNILFHDRNDRSLETTMKDLAENTMAHNTAMELLKSHFALLDIAIKERF